MKSTGNEEKPVLSWEDNRAMAGQAMRIHNAQYRAQQEKAKARASRSQARRK